ncbi:MAG: HAD family phosphatase [Leptolyngbya sp. SIO4C1]|nr:HAD family phosphatase [Leptolyngbya sp. SIO4C1]
MIKAALVSFNGVIVHDDAIQQQLIEQLLIEENLRPDPNEYRQDCLGRSDRSCLTCLLQRRGRFVTPADMKRLLTKKAAAYQSWLSALEKPPIYPDVKDLLFRIQSRQYKLALVTSAQAGEVEPLLLQAGLSDAFAVTVTGDDVEAAGSKPAPDSYQIAIERLNQRHPGLALTPANCVAIEATFVGIDAAKAAGIPVIGVAHSYPNHMLQRCATWVVDYLIEIDFDWITQRAPVGISQI